MAKVTGVINYVHDIAHEPHDVDVFSGDDVRGYQENSGFHRQIFIFSKI